MSRIPLRKYIQEIEILIENGNLDEAHQHCIYILQTFPKNIAVYRLLGKILMEKGSYEDSAFVFNKVLEVFPDDFIAHVGLSFLAEVHEQLDDAVMHMERAFELQPTNAVLKEELKRLHLKKDGIEPQNIRLTRGALVNMYLRSSLYPQAIAELKIGLQTNPSRVDFKEHLADALLKQGEKIEAVQTAIEVLGTAPFNFNANRIALETLPNTSDALDTQAFHHHLIDVDPYYVYVGDRIQNVDNVPDVAVSIDRYDGKKPKIDLEATHIQEEIEKHWNKTSFWKEGESQGSEIDWDSIIENKLVEKKEKTRKIPLESAQEANQEQIEEKKEEHLEKQVDELHEPELILEENEPTHDGIPGWIFDDPEEPTYDGPEKDESSTVEQTITSELDMDQSESGMVDQDVPTISEPESEVISKHWVKMENEHGTQSSLEDTQKIALQEEVEIFNAGIHAITEKDVPTAIHHFTVLLEKSTFVKDIIAALENSAALLENEPDAWYVLGKAYQKNDQKEKALEAFRKAEETSFS